MSVGESLINHLNDDGDVSSLVNDRVSQGAVNENETNPRIWIGRTSRDNEIDLGGGGFVTDTFDLEIVATHSSTNDGVSEALEIADAVRASLHGLHGDLYDRGVMGVFVDDQTDDYVPKAIDSPDGVYVSALSIRIMPCT